jgi:signal-transduction protein with cAMP-binding, CBS, and nucleotidyltransferase domain
MDQLERIFKDFGFSERSIFKITNCFSLKHFKSGELFIQKDTISEYLGFINKGVFQFFYEKDAEDITTYIALKNDFILSVPSFFAGQPSKENIKALVASEIWMINKSDFAKLKDTINGFKDFYITILEQLIVCIDESRFDYITLKPEERYSKLLKEEPELIRQIPLKYLSTMIGVTPRHLSRIRNNIR